MNNKAQSFPLAILSAVGVLIIGLMMINFLTPEIDTFRADLGCASVSSLTSGGKILCLIGDATVPYVIISILSVAVGAITMRITKR